MKKENRNSILFISGALLGLIFFLAIYGISPVIFTEDSFIINGYIEKDISQHYSGWMLYRNSPWRFPVGLGENIAYPYGNVVSFTDSIPLFAIFFKLFRAVLPETFQYFGLFVMLCFMLQGAFAALLCGLFNKNNRVCIFSSALFLLTPVMIERAFRHCALTAHFLIIASLYYYFKNKGRYDLKSFLPFIVINVLAVTIHPYFLPFTYGIMFAFCIEGFFIEKRYKETIAYLCFSLLITVIVAYIIGIFYVGNSVTSIGYGFFSMNLNALYNPVSKGFENWSAVLSPKPNMYLQTEGFNYLGLGIIVFVPIAGIICLIKFRTDIFRKFLAFVKNYFGIIFSTSALLVFAIGDWVRFGGLELFRIPFPEFLVNGIFGIFRANGRFGNMLVYMIVLFVVFSLLSLKNKTVSLVLIALLVSVQLFDISPALKSKYNYFHGIDENIQGQKAETVLKNSFWDDASEKFDCLYMISDCVPNANFELTVKFAKQNKAVNTRFDIKIDEEKFQKMEKDILNKVKNNTLDKESIVLLNFIPDKYKESIAQGSLKVYFAENIVVICNDIFSDDEIAGYKAQGNFEILEYPYTVQAEIDFKTEYGI